MAKKEKNTAVIFKGNEIIEQGKITYQQIADQCPDGTLSYRTTYAYFKRDGIGSIDVASKVALAIGKSLNDLYTPAQSGEWPKAAQISETDDNIVDAARIEKALMILDMLEEPFNYTKLSQAARTYVRERQPNLAEKMQLLAEYAKAEGGDQDV